MSNTKHPPIKDQLMYIFSSSELITLYLTLFYTLYRINLYTFLILIIIILKTIILSPIKSYSNNYKIGKRPNKAFNCNMMNCGGKTTSPGFPSGHMVNLGLLLFIILNLRRKGKDTKSIYLIYIILIISTAIGRYFTYCHTPLQIFIGLIIGLIFGFIIYLIDLFLEEYIEFYKKQKDLFYNDISKIFL